MSRAWYEVARKPGYSGNPWAGIFRSRHPDTLFHFRMLSAREAASMHLSRETFYVVESVDYTEPIHGDQSLTTSVPLHFDPSVVAHHYVEHTIPELWTGPLYVTAKQYEANMHKHPEPYVDRSHDPIPVGDPLKTNVPSVGELYSHDGLPWNREDLALSPFVPVYEEVNPDRRFSFVRPAKTFHTPGEDAMRGDARRQLCLKERSVVYAHTEQTDCFYVTVPEHFLAERPDWDNQASGLRAVCAPSGGS